MQSDNQPRKGKQCKGIRDHHQSIEEISQGPYKIYFQCGADNDEQHYQQRIEFGRFWTEQVLYINFCEEVPSEDGGKSEEQQTDGDKNISEAAGQ